MERYKNVRGNSPITFYEIENDRITVWFKGNSKPYIYPEFKIGVFHLNELRRRATLGSGLSAYITQNVKDKFI